MADLDISSATINLGVNPTLSVVFNKPIGKNGTTTATLTAAKQHF